MTAFPAAYGIDQDTYEVVPEDGSQVSEADDGTTRIRRLYGATQYRIEFELFGLSVSDQATLSAFYETNKNTIVEWTDPYTSIVYDLLMLRPPRRERMYGLHASMSFEFRGTAQ